MFSFNNRDFFNKLIYYFLLLSLLNLTTFSKKHTINITEDKRGLIRLSNFGFYENGYLFIHLKNITKPIHVSFYLLILDKTSGSGNEEYMNIEQSKECFNRINDSSRIANFIINFTSSTVTIEKFGKNSISTYIPKDYSAICDQEYCNKPQIISNNKINFINQETSEFFFTVNITNKSDIGLYTLNFINCDHSMINFTMYLEENNNGNFLSIGEFPLPIMYFLLSLVFFISASLWLYILCKSTLVFKIHYLMLVLIYVKVISLLFHGINYHFIEAKGMQDEAFAIVFYIIYLLKGILMFVTIVLIGAGWTFIKHILSKRDKKIFVFIIPLQILTNVIHIIIFESEEGQANYAIWYRVFIVIDLVCCGAILFPVIWSIRHLNQASDVDGKAAINLEKLKIFRQFYMAIVCYIYFTRIIVILLYYTVPFQFTWIGEFLVEIATLFFFIMTGYMFVPAVSNPYLRVSASDDEEEMEVVTKSGVFENVNRVNVKSKATTEVEGEELERPLVVNQRENSHEYD